MNVQDEDRMLRARHRALEGPGAGALASPDPDTLLDRAVHIRSFVTPLRRGSDYHRYLHRLADALALAEEEPVAS